MQHPIPRAKRCFDVAAGVAMLVAILPLLALFAAAVAMLEGRPIFYVSRRRVNAGPPVAVIKFRTMRRDADRIANRDTVPIGSTRFLNLPITSPLYTPVGRVIERLMLTEMPQLLHVLQGRMSIVGNRPLPENVVASLAEEFPAVEERFAIPAGLTGPVQLVGRDFISDAARLDIEIAYCRSVSEAYSVLLDFKILAYTVLGGFVRRFRFTPEGVLELIARHGAATLARRARRRAPAVLPPRERDDAAPPAVGQGAANR